MTYNGGRDIAMQMVEACNDFVLSAVRIAWDGGFYCHEFHGDVEMLFDKLATLWDEYWKNWAEAAEDAYSDERLAELRIKALQAKDISDPEVEAARRKAIAEIGSLVQRHKDMVKEHIGPEAQIILDRWLEDRRQRYGEEDACQYRN